MRYTAKVRSLKYRVVASNKVSKLATLINNLGEQQREYWESSDYASSYDVILRQTPYTKVVPQGREFNDFFDSLDDATKKKAWKWVQENTEATFNYWSFPGSPQKWSALTVLLDGEEHFQLSGIEDYDDLVADMTADELKEVASKTDDYYAPEEHTLYISQDYSLIDFVVDIDELKEYLAEDLTT